MANAKIISLIAHASDQLSERVEGEREADAKTIIEILEDELSGVRDDIDLLRTRVKILEGGSP